MAVLVIGRAPGLRTCKRRLWSRLGAAGAMRLQRALLDHTLRQARQAAVGPVVWWVAPGADDPAARALAARHRVLTCSQGPGDLGQRMQQALHWALDRWPAALLIGNDAPALRVGDLRRAARCLRQGRPAVLVPACDGGYALLGLRQPAPSLFGDIAWGSGAVLASTRCRLRTLGWRWVELPAVHDIDRPADLCHLPPGRPFDAFRGRRAARPGLPITDTCARTP